MKNYTNHKVSRGTLENELRKEERRKSNQKILLIVLPIFMVAILVIGIFFGYKSYQREYNDTLIESYEISTSETQNLTDTELLLTVVNSAYPLDSNFVPTLANFNGIKVSPLMLNDLQSLLKDAKDKGLDIVLKSGYISFEEQKELYSSSVKKYKKEKKASIVKAEAQVKKTTPKEGESECQTGLLVYFTNTEDKKFSSTKEYRWLYKNSINYGFILRYPDAENTGGMAYSSHYFRYVGKDMAIKMRSLDQTFDEYVIYVSKQ